jgi:glutamate synthase domain-containing protein 2/glutamate synthase domain-containing protein 1/glutamate synthase domain-containing protein 3
MPDSPYRRPARQGLYHPDHEHAACGVGIVANIDGSRTHEIVQQGLEALINLGHRGACGCDPRTGDGAGVLIQMPHAFMTEAARRAGIRLPMAGRYGVAMSFLPQDAGLRRQAEAAIEAAVRSEGLRGLGWRDVPVDPAVAGWLAREVMPVIRQYFAAAPDALDGASFERKLLVTRKQIENRVIALAKASPAAGWDDFYICSFSSRTIVYKGLLVADQIRGFYRDLREPSMVSAFAMVHSRFSTNTLGKWKLAHPYRMICHNGEINTLRGNINWMAAREESLSSDLFGDDIRKLGPTHAPGDSDTASFDKTFELLVLGGRSVEHAAAMMIPEPWFGHESMPEPKKAFYEYHGCLMEPWDGPALIAFTDGTKIGATLDRNGLRPFRYAVTKDGLLVMASETGVLDLPADRIEYKARLRPGRMFLLDTSEGRIIADEEIKSRLAKRSPYGKWLQENQMMLEELPESRHVPGVDLDTLLTRQAAFGYTQEDLRVLMEPMARDGGEPIGSMGNDSPLAVLSDRPLPLFNYFKQLFAQVSNPPLDAIREELVTQVSVTLGTHRNLFDETPEHCRLLRVDHPILTNAELAKIRDLKLDGLRARTISTLFNVAEGPAGLRNGLDRVRRAASDAVRDGCSILVLSDRGVDAGRAPIPSLLATSGVHHHLIREGTRLRVGLVVESGEPREVHHFAALFGYGAGAINPYLALETLVGMARASDGNGFALKPGKAETNYIKAAQKGVVKVMSKMGISTLQSYTGAQIFEALGLSQPVVDEFFTWTNSRIEGIGLDEIAEDVLTNHRRAFPEMEIPANLALDVGGLYLWRATGEKHMYNPDTIALLQDAVRRNDPKTFEEFSRIANDETRRLCTIRGLLEFKLDPAHEVPLDEVEPATAIARRFATGAISLGSISRETHETLAIAMNRLGARSNTGEGGEDHARFTPDPNGDSRSSAIKQVASGRFGVTIDYLVNARDLQIKMAQGSKPGEGGQIPGHKITEYIGKIRNTTPGVELISPPPHHDIYSIEDLAQLIHDLKNANPEARIHVKLVAEVGVGTIAAGVSKGKGDVVLISGDSGGTGASPLSSIKHAGLPWELGVAETQQVLCANGLRDRIVVQTDGQLKTARDVAVATLLGAEEWGIATGSLVALGCIMLRKCHLNTCSVGIATQDPELRKNFAGRPEHVINYFMMLAEDLRRYMAKLGFRTVDEMVGRTDRLEPRRAIDHWKARGLDLTPLLTSLPVLANGRRYRCVDQDHGLDQALDHSLIKAAAPAIERGERVSATFQIRNRNRTVGAMLSGRLVRQRGSALPDGTVNLTFRGSAGQSFGAFLAGGLTFRLEGDANDYFGKGLSGGRLILTPPREATYAPEENIITGNVNLYGATGGEAFIRGLAGERFAVRNSGARAVVEGVGDHGCEYMTGGRVVVIGPTGRNFAAGMSGGIAYVLDLEGDFSTRCNEEMVDLETVDAGSEDESLVRGLLASHVRYTGSSVAEQVLDDWNESRAKFVKVMPRDYKRMLGVLARREKTHEPELIRHG